MERNTPPPNICALKVLASFWGRVSSRGPNSVRSLRDLDKARAMTAMTAITLPYCVLLGHSENLHRLFHLILIHQWELEYYNLHFIDGKLGFGQIPTIIRPANYGHWSQIQVPRLKLWAIFTTKQRWQTKSAHRIWPTACFLDLCKLGMILHF